MSNITKEFSPSMLATMDVAGLAELANTSAEAHQGHHKKGLEAAYVAGQALNAAKSRLKHGEWGPWVKLNFLFSQQWACAYMKLAKLNRVEISEAGGIKAALKMLSGPSDDIDDTPVTESIQVIEAELVDDVPEELPTVTVVERGKPSQKPVRQVAVKRDEKTATPPRHPGEHNLSEVFALTTADVSITQLKGIPSKNKFLGAALNRVATWIDSQRDTKASIKVPEYLYSIGECGYEFWVHSVYRQKVTAKSGGLVTLSDLAQGYTVQESGFLSKDPDRTLSNVSEIDWRDVDEESYKSDMTGSGRSRELDLRRFEQRQGGGQYLYFEPGRVCYYDETAINAILAKQARSQIEKPA